MRGTVEAVGMGEAKFGVEVDKVGEVVLAVAVGLAEVSFLGVDVIWVWPELEFVLVCVVVLSEGVGLAVALTKV